MSKWLKPRIYEQYRTISEFAWTVNIKENRMTQIITGRSSPTPEEKRIIAEGLNLSEWPE